MKHITNKICPPSSTVDAFQIPGQAIKDTDWIQEPADPTQLEGGLIQKGEIVWFHREPFGSGPDWQQVRLNDQTLGYVNPHHFAKVEDIPKS